MAKIEDDVDDVEVSATGEELTETTSAMPKHGFFVRLYTGTGAFDVIGKRKLWFTISGVIVAIAVFARPAREKAAADALPAPPMGAKPRPIHVDGRLHRWEWITTADDRLIKTDALATPRFGLRGSCGRITGCTCGEGITLSGPATLKNLPS